MLISEIFHSIQGEGELTGVPSVFVRTSGCNLRCRWCDTPYASWKPEGAEMEVSRILDAVARFPSRHCVITGGEPMIARGIHELASKLRASGRHVTIETAGTIVPGGIACDLASLSPKMSNSTPATEKIGAGWAERHERTRRRPDVLAEWLRGYSCQFKFVIATEADAREALDFADAVLADVPRAKIFLMPEAMDAAILAERGAWLTEFCKEHGFRFGDRLHIRLFGNARGT